MLVSVGFAVCARGCSTEREKTAPDVRASVELEVVQSCSVEYNTVLPEEFSQRQMFRILLLSRSSFHGLFENTYKSRSASPFDAGIKWRRS